MASKSRRPYGRAASLRKLTDGAMDVCSEEAGTPTGAERVFS